MRIKECINEFDLYSDRVGIRILPSRRTKYMQGKDMYFASAKYRNCVIAYLRAKNGCVVFVITHAEAVKNGLVKED